MLVTKIVLYQAQTCYSNLEPLQVTTIIRWFSTIFQSGWKKNCSWTYLLIVLFVWTNAPYHTKILNKMIQMYHKNALVFVVNRKINSSQYWDEENISLCFGSCKCIPHKKVLCRWIFKRERPQCIKNTTISL